jgi:hypothetical protein
MHRWTAAPHKAPTAALPNRGAHAYCGVCADCRRADAAIPRRLRPPAWHAPNGTPNRTLKLPR